MAKRRCAACGGLFVPRRNVPQQRYCSKLRRLLELKHTYPAEPFLAAIAQALHYGLFDLTRLERLILERVAGEFFDLNEQP
jgi:hypothetical protein